MMQYRRPFGLLSLLLLLGSGSAVMKAQVAPAAFRDLISLTVGGMVTAYHPQYIPNKLAGAGAYVDLNILHGVGIEALGRWQRIHETYGISQDNYLIGPRVKVLHFWRVQPYVKALGGFSNMNFEFNTAHGRFTTFEFGGGVDIRLNHHWSVRALDAEYQYWLRFLGDNLKPYGANIGIGYRIF